MLSKEEKVLAYLEGLINAMQKEQKNKGEFAMVHASTVQSSLEQIKRMIVDE